jgi:hypothetical protein
MYEAERIPKNGQAPKEMGGYRFVQVGDATDYIRKALAENVLTMMPTAVRVVGQADRPTKSGGNMTTVDLIVTWTITDGQSGESIQIESFGAGADGGDKYSGKASTSAMKYALLTGFLLSTGDDTEAARLPEQRHASAPIVADVEKGSDGSLIGTAEVGDRSTSDYSIRNTPDGPVLGFRLRGEKGGILVRTRGQLARDLDTLRAEVIGHRVTCWGRITTESFTPAKKGAREVSYQVLDADRVQIPGLPMLPTALTEAPSVPLFDDQDAIEMAEGVEREIDYQGVSPRTMGIGER